MVELERIKRAVARRDEIQVLLESYPKRREQVRARLDEIMKTLDPDIPLEVPYVKQEVLDEILKLRASLKPPISINSDPVAIENQNLFYANRYLSDSVSLGWQGAGVCKQIAILDEKIGHLHKLLEKPFDARDQKQIDEVLRLRAEERQLSITRWNLIKQLSEMLGYDDPSNPQQLNSELKAKGPDAVRTELVEKLKEFGSRPRAPKEVEEVE